MKGQAVPPNLCDHFTGCYAGKCRAGVEYDSVKDQDRRGQMARFPCDRSLNSFTSCPLARFTPPAEGTRRRVALSDKNKGREIIYEYEVFGGREQLRGRLVGWSGDGETLYLDVSRGRRRRNMVDAPAKDCRLERRRRGGSRESGKDDVATGLPLLDARPPEAAEPARLEGRRTGKAQGARPGRKAA